MSDEKKIEANSASANISTNPPIQEEDKLSNVNMQFAEDFAERFIRQYTNYVKQMNSSGGVNNNLNPMFANSLMKRFDSYSIKPTEANITKWLANPRNHERELRATSYFLNDAVQQYNRSVAYVSNLLNFDYELIPLNPPTIDSDVKTIALYQKQKQKANDWLRLFRVKEQFSNVLLQIVRSGGKCYYLRKNNENDGVYLQEMPEDYVTINGRTDAMGYTYSLNMSYFYSMTTATEGFAPEIADWYKEFLDKKSLLNEQANPWRPMPYDKSVVFKFDDSRVEMIPPLSGTMIDAIAITNYKDLMRLNIELQNFCLLYLQTPLDKDSKPTISAQETISYTALVQSLVNNTTSVISSPMEMKSVDFKNSSSKDDILGIGESSFWSSSGIAGGIFGESNSSAIGLKFSILADFDYVSPIYNQLERFLNFHINDIDGKFNFNVKFLRRCSFFLDDDKKSTISACQLGLPPERLLASYGYQPYEIDGILRNSIINGTRDMMIPLQSSYTQSGSDNKDGSPVKSDSEIGDSGAKTRDKGSNDLKV